MNNNKDQYRIPSPAPVPGEVIKTYTTGEQLTAQQALDIALAAAGETAPQLDPTNIDQARVEQRAALGGAATVRVAVAEQPRSAIDTRPEALRRFGANVQQMRQWEMAA